MQPASTQENSAVPRSVQQPFAQHPLNVRKDLGGAGGMQPVAAVIDPHAAHIETAGVTSRNAASFDHRDVEDFTSGQPAGGADARGTGAQYDDGYTPAHSSDTSIRISANPGA